MSSVNGAEHSGKAFGKLLKTKEMNEKKKKNENVMTACLDESLSQISFILIKRRKSTR